MITRFVIVALVVFAPMLASDPNPVDYVPGSGCVVTSDRGSLTDAEVSRRLAICVDHHYGSR